LRSLFELKPRNHRAMNIPRLIFAIVAGFVVIFASDWLIHGIWMKSDYQATQQLWRPEVEMQSHMGWMLCAQLLTVITFVLLWTRWAETARFGCAVGFGLLMGMFSGVWAIVLYVILPMPGAIAAKWFVAGVMQCILLGIVTFYVYKPAASATAS
jgi:hypothetical protein